jgi:Ankyrin repeat
MAELLLKKIKEEKLDDAKRVIDFCKEMEYPLHFDLGLSDKISHVISSFLLKEELDVARKIMNFLFENIVFIEPMHINVEPVYNSFLCEKKFIFAKEILDFSKKTKYITISKKNIRNIFKNFLEHDDLNSAKKLYDLHGKECFDIKILNNIFPILCWENKLNSIKFLWDIMNEINQPLNIHLKEETPFVWACQNGSLDVVKWLWDLSLKINSPISVAGMDCAFNTVCDKKKIEIAEWLCNKCERYEFVTQDKEIVYFSILSKKELPNNYSNKKIKLYSMEDSIEV